MRKAKNMHTTNRSYWPLACYPTQINVDNKAIHCVQFQVSLHKPKNTKTLNLILDMWKMRAQLSYWVCIQHSTTTLPLKAIEIKSRWFSGWYS